MSPQQNGQAETASGHELVRVDGAHAPGRDVRPGAAARSLEEAVESCSAASGSLRAASDSLRAASRSVQAASESFRSASSLRVVWSVRTSLQIGSAWGRASSGLLLPPPPSPLSGGRRRRRAFGLRGRRGGAADWGYVDRRRGPVDRRHAPRETSPLEGPHGGRSAHDRRRRPARRALGALSTLLIALGVLGLADAGTTLVWQEPVSAIYATIQQDGLRDSLARLDRSAPTPAIAARLAAVRQVRARVALLGGALERGAPDGSAVGRLRVARIGLDFALVKGTSTADLEKGPGVYSRGAYPQSAFPGVGGLTAIAGHRTTFLAPFRHIDELRPGDGITIRMPYARFAYTVRRVRIVKPTNVRAALHPGAGTQLVLSSCNPPFSAAQRILVYAGLTSVTPLGAARAYEQSLRARGSGPATLGSGLGLPADGLRGNV